MVKTAVQPAAPDFSLDRVSGVVSPIQVHERRLEMLLATPSAQRALKQMSENLSWNVDASLIDPKKIVNEIPRDLLPDTNSERRIVSKISPADLRRHIFQDACQRVLFDIFTADSQGESLFTRPEGERNARAVDRLIMLIGRNNEVGYRVVAAFAEMISHPEFVFPKDLQPAQSKFLKAVFDVYSLPRDEVHYRGIRLLIDQTLALAQGHSTPRNANGEMTVSAKSSLLMLNALRKLNEHFIRGNFDPQNSALTPFVSPGFAAHVEMAIESIERGKFGHLAHA